MYNNYKKSYLTLFVLFVAFFSTQFCIANTDFEDFEHLSFDDKPVIDIVHPDWFKESFLDLKEDLAEAKDNGKKGIIIYLGQKNCAYCKALIENNFGQDDISKYTQEHFYVVAVDIWGAKEIVTLDDEVLTEREYAIKNNANFTPSLIFYDTEGDTALFLRGYHPPYQFRAALEYVVEGYYQQESFRTYLDRVNTAVIFEPGEINFEPFFIPAPYALDRSKVKAQKPLLVFFEQKDCYSCDVLHSEPLNYKATQKLLKGFNAVQIDMLSDTPVLTPTGEHLTAKQWAKKLNIFYTPTIIAFDESGNEIMRIDSVAGIYRLNNVLKYLASKAYLKVPNFVEWTFQRLFKNSERQKGN